MRYVILSHPTELTIVLFSLGLTHAQLAEPWLAKGYKPKTAGFVRITEGKFETFGRSSSLNVESHPDDSRVIAALHGAALRAA